MVSCDGPVEMSFFNDKQIIYVSAGGLHSLALSSTGIVYSWGCNDEKALGRAGSEFEVEAVPIPTLENERVIQVCTGDSISAALTDKGRLFTWGTFRDSQGVMGHSGREIMQERASILSELSHLKIVKIAAGANHLVALTQEHLLYTWGCGEQGQLGRRVLERHKLLGLRPTNVTPRHGRSQVKIGKVVCGSYHTLAISQDDAVYAMGLNNYGQLGLGDHEPRPNAERIEKQWRVVDVAAGEHHSLALDDQGILYSFGRHDFGQLGIQGLSERAMNSPHPIPTLHAITSMAVGGNHNLAVDKDGIVYSWGYGEMGQLGHGVERDEVIPRQINASLKGSVMQVSAGGQHSIILTK